MVEKHLVTEFHAIAHHVSGLIITHAVPMFGLIGLLLQIINTERVRFGFH
jgi:hypothetical protein